MQPRTKILMSDYFKPTDRQKIALRNNGKGKRIFYGGSRGGGKTRCAIHLALETAKRYPTIKVIVLRKNYRELEDYIILEFKKLYPASIFKYKYSGKHNTATFSNGSVIFFRAIEKVKDIEKVQGVEYQLMIIDEAPLFDQKVLEMLTGSLRNAHIPDYIATLFMTGNPGGISDYYFKTRFIKPDYTKWEPNEKLYPDDYIFIPARVYDNPYVEKDYIRKLESLSPHLRKLWLEGDWDSTDGQFLEQWSNEKHIVSHLMTVPQEWRRVAGLDLGFTPEHPTVLVIAAQDPDTYKVYQIFEYQNYGQLGTYIKDIVEYIQENDVYEIYADPAMWGDKRAADGSGESSATMFEAEGVPIMKANNSRVEGWRVVKRWLDYTNTPDGEPLYQVFDTCTKTIEDAPLLRYADRGATGEDCNTKGRDDAWDAIRYMLKMGFVYPLQEDLEMMERMEHDLEKIRRINESKFKTSYEDIEAECYYG